jgi:hypothetical protein
MKITVRRRREAENAGAERPGHGLGSAAAKASGCAAIEGRGRIIGESAVKEMRLKLRLGK